MAPAAERSLEALRSSLVDVAVREDADLTGPLPMQRAADALEALATHRHEIVQRRFILRPSRKTKPLPLAPLPVRRQSQEDGRLPIRQF